MSQFIGFLGAAYPWVKAAHVTFVIFWISGLFLLPRFYVYHHATTPGSAEDRAWIEREASHRKLVMSTASRVCVPRASASVPSGERAKRKII